MDAGQIPRGVEVLVKKAAVDAEFRALLLEKCADAAKEIGLDLDPSEAAMLAAIPAAQLEAIVAGTKVDAKVRPALLGKAAAVMIAALGVGVAGCKRGPASAGVRPDRPTKVEPKAEKASDASTKPAPDKVARGIRPDRPRSR